MIACNGSKYSEGHKQGIVINNKIKLTSGKMVKVALFEEVAFTLRSKARGMNHAKKMRKSALRIYKSLCKGPEAVKSLESNKNKKKRREGA